MGNNGSTDGDRMIIALMIVMAMSVQSNLPPACSSLISSATAMNETDWIAIRGMAMMAPNATRIIKERNATPRAARAPPIKWSHLLDSLRKLIIFFHRKFVCLGLWV